MILRREGTLKAGDRILSVDGVVLHSATLSDALTVLTQCGQESLIQIEYDVSIMGELLQFHLFQMLTEWKFHMSFWILSIVVTVC